MDSLDSSVSPCIKLELSPTDSLLSDPSGVFPSLFSASGSTIASSGAATPVDSGAYSGNGDMDAQVVDLDKLDDLYAAQLENDRAPEKKNGKKRKSWGQVLPEPKTNLPPRKRAKTEDEKEQRRVERVLRNRRAAQSSRERKRLEVDALERRNQELEALLAKAQSDNMALYAQLSRLQGKAPVPPTATPPVTLSRELFSSQNGHASSLRSYLSPSDTPTIPATIDPVSLSPAMAPVSDSKAGLLDEAGKTELLQAPQKPQMQHNTTPFPQTKSQEPERLASNGPDVSAPSQPGPSPDMTQRPAATLCSDLQCDLVAIPYINGVYHMAQPGEQEGYVVPSDYLDLSESRNAGYAYLADSEYAAPFLANGGAGDFDIGDFFDADGLTHASGNDVAFGHRGYAAAELACHHASTVDA